MYINGKYTDARIFTDLIEEKAIEQIVTLLNQEFVSGSKIRIMPDVHAGAGCTIGTTMTIKDKVCPNLVGVDIGCGMLTIELAGEDHDLERLDKTIRLCVPSGFNIRKVPHMFADFAELDDLRCEDHVNIDRAKLSIGTLGGGNHFIELDRDDDGHAYLVVHTGSRHLGKEVAEHYQKLAVQQIRGIDKSDIDKLVSELKAQGRHNEIKMEIDKLKNSAMTVPKDLAYVSGEYFEDYIHDMKIVQHYAHMNRLAILETIMRNMGWHSKSFFSTIHNYIDTDSMILRKGAVSAKKGEHLIIPMNMRDGSLICIGKGNDDWNQSAPHGAGRLMSRAAAKKKFTVEEFKESMNDIYTTSVGIDTLDECPMAYKPMESIIENIGDTVEIEKIIRPIYNFKAGE